MLEEVRRARGDGARRRGALRTGGLRCEVVSGRARRRLSAQRSRRTTLLRPTGQDAVFLVARRSRSRCLSLSSSSSGCAPRRGAGGEAQRATLPYSASGKTLCAGLGDASRSPASVTSKLSPPACLPPTDLSSLPRTLSDRLCSSSPLPGSQPPGSFSAQG